MLFALALQRQFVLYAFLKCIHCHTFYRSTNGEGNINRVGCPAATVLPSSNVLKVWLQHSPTIVQRLDYPAATVPPSSIVLSVWLQHSPTVPTLAERVDCLATTVLHSHNVFTVRRSCVEVRACSRYTSCIPRRVPCTKYT